MEGCLKSSLLLHKGPNELLLPLLVNGVIGNMVQAIHEVLMGDMDIRSVLQLELFKNHVDHLSGRKSKATLIGEFADCIASDTLTWEKFQLYYRAVATSTMANETVFTQLVRTSFLFADRQCPLAKYMLVLLSCILPGWRQDLYSAQERVYSLCEIEQVE